MKRKKIILISIILLICAIASVVLYYSFFVLDSPQKTDEGTIETKTEKITENNEKEYPMDYIIENARMAKEIKNREIEIYLPQIQFVNGGQETLEDKINETLYNAAVDWMTYDFLGMEISQLNTNITCHSGKYLSVSLSYHLDVSPGGDTLLNYIVVDMTTGDRIFLKDIIEDEKELASQIKKEEGIHAGRGFAFDQYETDQNLHEYILEKTEEEFYEIIRQCSMEEKEFPLRCESEQSMPTIWRKSGFYIEGNCIVIDCSDTYIHIEGII